MPTMVKAWAQKVTASAQNARRRSARRSGRPLASAPAPERLPRTPRSRTAAVKAGTSCSAAKAISVARQPSASISTAASGRKMEVVTPVMKVEYITARLGSRLLAVSAA